MNFTFILALIGCITGLSSLLIQLFEYLGTISKLEITVDDYSNSYFFKTQDFGVKRYLSTYSAVVSFKISNCSLYPITINAITASIGGIEYVSRHDNNFTFQPKDFLLEELCDGRKSYRSYRPTESFQIPERIDSYDTIYASARFPFIDEFVDPTKTHEPIYLNISIVTPRKVFRRKVKLYEYTHLHDLRLYHPRKS